jgi:hypothetical protein
MSSMAVQKPTGPLKAFLAASKRKRRLLDDVERHIHTVDSPPRSTTVLHPSEIVKHDWCHRASWFALKGHPVPKEQPGLRLQNIFDEGHAIHDKWQSRFWRMGALYGRWVCLHCEDTWWDQSPEGCQSCGSKALKYAEVSLASDPRLKIAGHADGWVKGIGDDALIEIKSVGFGTIRMEAPRIAATADGNLDEAWRQVRAPFRTHVRQGALYLELGWQMVQMGFLDSFPEEIVFIYELKSNQDIKEFTIQRDPALVRDVLIDARKLVAALDDDTPVACNIDMQQGCSKCRVFEGVVA